MTVVCFLIAVIGAPVVFGLPLAVHPTLRAFSLPARASLAWAAGSFALTAILTLTSALGLRWTPWFWVLFGTLAVAAGIWTFRQQPRATSERSRSHGAGHWLALIVLMPIAAGTLSAFAIGAATSADLSYFWGVKGLHYALAQGVDFELLKQPFMIHLHPNYPPLWPVLLGWGALVAHDLPWLELPSLTWFCLTAAAAVIFSVIETRLGTSAAAAVTCLWYAALGVMMVTSFSGGNADGPLLLFVSIALVVVLAENEDGCRRLRWVAAVALAGAVFTKSEGMVITALIAIGTAVRDLMWRRRGVLQQTFLLVAPALAAAGLWIVVRIVGGLPLTDPIRETAFQISFDNLGLIVLLCARILTSGVVAVAWLVPLVALAIVGSRRLAPAVPALVTSFGIPLFALVYYLHAVGDPRELIVWTFPRLIQPAISAWILGLGVAAFSVTGRRDAEALTVHEVTR